MGGEDCNYNLSASKDYNTNIEITLLILSRTSREEDFNADSWHDPKTPLVFVDYHFL